MARARSARRQACTTTVPQTASQMETYHVVLLPVQYAQQRQNGRIIPSSAVKSPVVCGAAGRSHRAVAYLVTTTADGGPGSLRDRPDAGHADTSHALYASADDPAWTRSTSPSPPPRTQAGGTTPRPGSAHRSAFGLPRITNAVLLDGYTQAGASPNTVAGGNNAVLKIELDGENAGDGVSG